MAEATYDPVGHELTRLARAFRVRDVDAATITEYRQSFQRNRVTDGELMAAATGWIDAPRRRDFPRADELLELVREERQRSRADAAGKRAPGGVVTVTCHECGREHAIRSLGHRDLDAVRLAAACVMPYCPCLGSGLVPAPNDRPVQVVARTDGGIGLIPCECTYRGPYRDDLLERRARAREALAAAQGNVAVAMGLAPEAPGPLRRVLRRALREPGEEG